MKFVLNTLIAAAAVLGMTAPAASVPLSPAAGGIVLASQFDAAGSTIQVNRRGGPIAAGIIGGAIIGGIIASQPRYYYYGSPYPVYGWPYPLYAPAYPRYAPYSVVDPAIAYCMRRYRSYDPMSMTYLGYDGFRRPCP